MPRVLMNFQYYKDWVVHFIEADCRTTIGRRTRYIHFASEDGLPPSSPDATSKTWPTSSTPCVPGREAVTSPTSPTSSTLA
jgi:hypothetical protein